MSPFDTAADPRAGQIDVTVRHPRNRMAVDLGIRNRRTARVDVADAAVVGEHAAAGLRARRRGRDVAPPAASAASLGLDVREGDRECPATATTRNFFTSFLRQSEAVFDRRTA